VTTQLPSQASGKTFTFSGGILTINRTLAHGGNASDRARGFGRPPGRSRTESGSGFVPGRAAENSASNFIDPRIHTAPLLREGDHPGKGVQPTDGLVDSRTKAGLLAPPDPTCGFRLGFPPTATSRGRAKPAPLGRGDHRPGLSCTPRHREQIFPLETQIRPSWSSCRRKARSRHIGLPVEIKKKIEQLARRPNRDSRQGIVSSVQNPTNLTKRSDEAGSWDGGHHAGEIGFIPWFPAGPRGPLAAPGGPLAKGHSGPKARPHRDALRQAGAGMVAGKRARRLGSSDSGTVEASRTWRRTVAPPRSSSSANRVREASRRSAEQERPRPAAADAPPPGQTVFWWAGEHARPFSGRWIQFRPNRRPRGGREYGRFI